MTPLSAGTNGRITTIEGLGTENRLHPLQRAFIEEQACQCGFCGNGMVIAAKALLDRTPRPTTDQIKQALNGHLCRCASHNRIVRAVQRAAKELERWNQLKRRKYAAEEPETPDRIAAMPADSTIVPA